MFPVVLMLMIFVFIHFTNRVWIFCNLNNIDTKILFIKDLILD